MKPTSLTLLVLISLLPLAGAQEKAADFDAEAAKARLGGEVARTPGKFTAKGLGGDPITGRVYTKDAVVVTRASGAHEEHPYVAVPLLFRPNSDELRDARSRENTVKVAQMLKELGAVTFAIEGHASAEGDEGRNRELSKLRAAKIQTLLREQGVPAAQLVRVEGFGSDHAAHPANAPEPFREEDRRVLVVKER